MGERRHNLNSIFSAEGSFDADGSAVLEQMTRIDRYERRALARRRSAIQRFTSCVQEESAMLAKTGKTKPKISTISEGA